MVSKKFLLIINPTSGSGRGKKWEKWFKKESSKFPNVELVIRFSSKSGEDSIENLAKMAESCGYCRVIVVGGDGSFNEAANGLVNSNIPLAVIALGTANDFPIGLGIPRNVKKAFRIAMSGKEVSIDLGKFNGIFFVNVASFGFDAEIVKMVSESREGYRILSSKWLYVLTLLKKLSAPLEFSTIKINGGIERIALGFVVTNGPQYGGKFKISPTASYTDGLLDCCLIPRMNRLKLSRMIFRLLSGTHEKISDIITEKKSFLVVSSCDALSCEVDGEVFESSKDYINSKDYIITVHPKALKVVIPREGIVR